jgi:hypothetical protein
VQTFGHGLLAPILLLHGGRLYFGGVEADDFEVHSAIRADDDLTDFYAGFESDLGITFRTVYWVHGKSPFESKIKIKNPP